MTGPAVPRFAAVPEGVGPPRRRERNAAETKRRILDAGEAEFAAKGFDGARLGTIARAAGVQQALIHHYFGDKGGLYRDVIGRALGGMSAESLGILAGLNARVGPFAPRKRLTERDIAEIASAFVELLLRFYAHHGAIASILRYEAQKGHSMALDVFVSMVKPVFDAVVARIDEMRARGELARDIDARHLCLSAVAMASAPFQEEHLLNALWRVDVRSEAFLAARKAEIVRTILARVLASA